MNTTINFFTNLGNNFSNFITRYFKHHLSYNSKKLIYLTSILGILEYETPVDRKIIEKLNSILFLVNHTSFIVLPLYFRFWIWKTVSMKSNIILSTGKVTIGSFKIEQLTENEYFDVANHFVRRMPSWLRYDNEFNMLRDLCIAFKELYKVKTA